MSNFFVLISSILLLSGCGGLAHYDEATTDRVRSTFSVGSDSYETFIQFSDADQRNAWVRPLNWNFDSKSDANLQRMSLAGNWLSANLCRGRYAPANASLKALKLINVGYYEDTGTDFTSSGEFPGLKTQSNSRMTMAVLGQCT